MILKKNYMLILCIIVSIIGVFTSILNFCASYLGNASYIEKADYLFVICIIIYFVFIDIIMVKHSAKIKKLSKDANEFRDADEFRKKNKRNKKWVFINKSLILAMLFLMIFFIIMVFIDYNSSNTYLKSGLTYLFLVYVTLFFYFCNLALKIQIDLIKDKLEIVKNNYKENIEN